jgi:aryl-alcohol dehydrogenase-like predicted oxidoreductase
VRYIGASTMAAWQLAKAQTAAERGGWTRFVSMQNRYNLLDRESEREVIPLCRDQGMGLIPYSPLARGLLAGSRGDAGQPLTARARLDVFQQEFYEAPGNREVVGRVAAVAAERGVRPAQVALAWVLHRPGITGAILGATHPSHIDNAVEAAQLELSPGELAQLEDGYVPKWIDATEASFEALTTGAQTGEPARAAWS